MLLIAIKAVKDTPRPLGLVPALLIFGTMPKIPIKPRKMPYHVNRMSKIIPARLEMSELARRSRITTALRKNVPKAAQNNLIVGEEVLMYRESSFEKWLVSFVATDMKDTAVTLNTGDRLINVSVDKIKRYE